MCLEAHTRQHVKDEPLEDEKPRGRVTCATVSKPLTDPSYNGKPSVCLVRLAGSAGWKPAPGDCLTADVRSHGDLVAAGERAVKAGPAERDARGPEELAAAGADDNDQDDSTEIDEQLEDEQPLPKKRKVSPGVY